MEHAQAPASEVRPAAWSRQTWIRLYLVLFLAAEAVILIGFAALGGDSRVREEMLQQAEALAAAGEHGEVLDVYLEYGRRWPGAYGTQNFELRLGQAYFNAGDFEESALHFERSVAANPRVRDTRALAGRSWWQAGERARALELFSQELSVGNPENDIAQIHLGLAALEEDRYAEALEYLAAAGNAAEAETREARARAEEQLLAPARERAQQRARELFGEPSNG